jgi:sugar lactone lactonase YvrE
METSRRSRRGGKRLHRAVRLSLAIATFGFPALASEGSTSVRLPDSSRFPESVTSDADGALFVSSIADGGVLKVDGDGAVVSRFLKPGDHGTRSTFGLLADPKRGVLWVASNDATALGVKGPTATEGAWVKAFDVATGAMKTSVRLPGGKALANDMALDGDGSLYVTNTFAPQILRLKPGATEFEVLVENEALGKGLDGIAFGSDGNLYVNTFMGGELFRIAMDRGVAGEVSKLETTRPLTFPDGLKAYKDGFLMVEGSGALSRVTVSGSGAKIEPIRQFAGPTGVTVAGDRIWVSEGQLGLLSKTPEFGREGPTFHLRSVGIE